MKNKSKEVVIVGCVRTPIGAFKGSLKDIRAHQLGSIVIKEVLKRSKFNKDECKLSYKLAIDTLEEKKNKAYIIKQTQKLKDIAQQIDNLDIKSNDYDYKLKILNKLYDRVKRDIENKLYNKESTKEEIESDEKERIELNKQIEESKLKKDIDELNDKSAVIARGFNMPNSGEGNAKSQ